MAKIKALDSPNLRYLRNRVNDLIQPLEEELGIKLRVGNATYGDGFATYKLEVNLVINGNVISKEVADFKMYARTYGLQPEDLGRKFLFQGEEYTVYGLKLKAPKWPIICEKTKDKKRYKFSESMVRHLLQPSRPHLKR